MKPNLSIVIPVFNQVSLTQRCLNSLLANSQVARELIVVDNHSTDATPEVLREYKKRAEHLGWRMEVIPNTINQGFGRACNQGIRMAQGELVAILNNDTWLMPGWDAVLVRRQAELSAAMIAPYYDERPFEADQMVERASRFVSRNQGKISRDWVSVLMLFPRSTLDQVGLFDERYFVTYEDTDLRERMDRQGLSYYKTADCYIWHHSKGTRDHQLLPSGYELEGLRLFKEKWQFDPREREHTLRARFKRRWQAWKARRGLF